MFRDAYTYKRKKEKPNSLRDQPTISFRCDLDGETLGYLKSLKRGKARSQFINQAIIMKHFHDKYHKGFLLQMMQHNFYQCKHLLRQIGSAFSELQNREANSKGLNTKEQAPYAKK
ncbi:MAG: hypothetical protein AABW89_05075 [Nanoarchaeota archaeon]